MAKHHKDKEAQAEQEQEMEQVEVEQPKEKAGDKVETAVDGVKKERAPRAPKNVLYRVLDGVDASKFIGQRGHVIRALQKLAEDNSEAFHSVEHIAAKTEGLVSRTPIIDSVTYHLKGLAKDGQVVTSVPASETKKEEPVAA